MRSSGKLCFFFLLFLASTGSTSVHSAPDHYQALGVEKNASEDDIKRAHRRLVQQFHPDRPDGKTEEGLKKYKDACEAYNVLSDSEKRARYDQGDPWTTSSSNSAQAETDRERLNQLYEMNFPKARWSLFVKNIFSLIKGHDRLFQTFEAFPNPERWPTTLRQALGDHFLENLDLINQSSLTYEQVSKILTHIPEPFARVIKLQWMGRRPGTTARPSPRRQPRSDEERVRFAKEHLLNTEFRDLKEILERCKAQNRKR